MSQKGFGPKKLVAQNHSSQKKKMGKKLSKKILAPNNLGSKRFLSQKIFVKKIIAINLLTLAGLQTVFGVAGPSVTNLLTLAGLWTLFWYNHVLHVYWKFCLYPKSVHRPARGSRFVTLGLTSLKRFYKPARDSKFVIPILKVSINLAGLAGLWH